MIYKCIVAKKQQNLIAYQSLPRLWQKHRGGGISGQFSSFRRDLEDWVSGDSGLQIAANRYHPCNIQLWFTSTVAHCMESTLYSVLRTFIVFIS